MRPNQCTVGTIAATELCVEGVQINWSQFLLNKLLIDAFKSQEKDNAFHYSWILILISFVTWVEPPNYQWVDLPLRCRGSIYQNLRFEKDMKDKEQDNNVQFFMHQNSLRH